MRALGRVMVHEVIHAMAPGHPHAVEGVMRLRQRRASLVGPAAVIDPGCVWAFLAALASASARS